MKKILYICEATGGGVRKHLIDLLHNIDSSKYELYLIYSENRADEVFFTELDNLKTKINFIKNNYMVREISLKEDTKALINIYKSIKKIKPDIVHCHSSKAGVLGRVAAKFAGVRKIYYTPHAYSTQNQTITRRKRFLFNFIESILSRFFTTASLNVSEGEKTFAISNYIDKPNKFKVIYNGIDNGKVNCDLDNLKKEFGFNNDDIIIGVAARLDDQKDPWTFIKIAEKIVQRYENARFVYIGDGKYTTEIEKYIADKGLSRKILLTGFRSDVESILQIFDIYLITSLYEGLPYSLIEALKARLPIVATNIPGNNEIVIDGHNGMLFEVKDFEDGANKVQQILSRNCDIDSMKQNSYNLFIEKFTIDKMIKEIENVYNQ